MHIYMVYMVVEVSMLYECCQHEMQPLDFQVGCFSSFSKGCAGFLSDSEK